MNSRPICVSYAYLVVGLAPGDVPCRHAFDGLEPLLQAALWGSSAGRTLGIMEVSVGYGRLCEELRGDQEPLERARSRHD